MFPVQFACFLAQGQCLDILVAHEEERVAMAEARLALARHYGGPGAHPYGTDGFLHGIAIPKGSPFRPGAGWRLGIRPNRMEEPRLWEVFVPDLQTVDGRNHAAKMGRMVLPDAAALTAKLGSTPVSASETEANISIHQHHIASERVGEAWVLWVPIPLVSEFWKDGVAQEKGIPFTPKGSTRVSAADYLRLTAAAGQRPNPAMQAV